MTDGNYTLERNLGQLFLVGFPGKTNQAPQSIRQALAEERIGGTILFRRNLEDLEQIKELTESIHQAAALASAPPFVAIDQEGGRVVRIRAPLTELPTMRALGSAQDLRDVARVSEVLATEIAALGFNLNFAPVLDVDSNPDNPVIGDRAFSANPERVARCGAGFLVGHHTAGVIPCGKHFPGHGDTLEDSHKALPRLMHDLERLEAVELFPFERAIAAGIPMLMTAHIELPLLDAFRPATLSASILDDLLRKRLRFEGVIVTDCLEMKAVADRYEIEEMVELGLEAGVDLFLICHTEEKWRRAYNHLLELARKDIRIEKRIAASATRIRKMKTDLLGHWTRPWSPSAAMLATIGCEEHQKIVAPYVKSDTLGLDPTELT